MTFIAVSRGRPALGIFLLLQAAFSSWRLAAVGMVTLPAALAGGVLAAVVFDDSVTIGTVVGFVAVFGLATRQRHRPGSPRATTSRTSMVRSSDARSCAAPRGTGFAPTFTSLVAVGAVFMRCSSWPAEVPAARSSIRWRWSWSAASSRRPS